MSARCACRSGRLYKRCCQPWHDGRPAPTALALMRSRYCAYARGLVEYIMATTHPDGPHQEDDPGAWADGIRAFTSNHRFVGLTILDHEESGDEGWVSFRAGLELAGEDASFSERSRFLRVEGRWFYRDGSAGPS